MLCETPLSKGGESKIIPAMVGQKQKKTRGQ